MTLTSVLLLFIIILLLNGNDCTESTKSSHPLFETYQGYKEGEIGDRFKDKFDKYLPVEGREKMRILHVGAKTSDFAEKLYEDGFQYIDNIDLLEMKMNIMTNRMKELNIPNTVRFEVADMFEFGESNSYDVVIDKGVIELTPEGHNKYLPHCWDILKENGLFISIGPFPPRGSKENGWWIGGDMAPSNWITKEKNGWKLEGVEVVNNSYIRVPHPDKFYLYFVRKTEKDEKNKDEI